MQNLGTKTIFTERLKLRPFTADDADIMFDNWASDDVVTKYLPWDSHSSIDITKQLLLEWVNSYKNPDFYQWCIEYNGEAIGSISVIEIDEESKTCEIGYCIGKRWWNQGITSEALFAIRNYLIDEVGFKHLWAWHHINNPNSGRVLQKCGFEKTAIVDDSEKYMNSNSKVVIYEYLIY